MVIEMGENKNNIDLEELLKVGKYYPIKCNVNTENGPKYFEELIYKGKIGRSYVFFLLMIVTSSGVSHFLKLK